MKHISNQIPNAMTPITKACARLATISTSVLGGGRVSEYISREELIDRLRKTELSADQIRMLVYPKEAVVGAIYDCPSADVRPNIHGHWERMSDLPEDKDDRYKCSQCGNVVHHSNGVNLYHFNSWCGRCGSLNNSLIAGLEPKGEKGET